MLYYIIPHNTISHYVLYDPLDADEAGAHDKDGGASHNVI